MSPWQVLHAGNNPASAGYHAVSPLAKDIERQNARSGPDAAHQVMRQIGVASGYEQGEADRYWLELTLAFAREYPGRFISQLAKKALATAQRFDFHHNTFARQIQRRLGEFPLAPMTLFAALGLVGLAVSRPLMWPMLLVLLAQLAVCVAFFPSTRLRLPLLVPLSIGAGVLVAALLRRLRALRALEAQQARSREPVAGRLTRYLKLAGPILGAFAGYQLLTLSLPPAHHAAAARALRERANDQFQAAAQPLSDYRLDAAQQQLSRAFLTAPWMHARLPIAGVDLPLRRWSAALVDQASVQAHRAPNGWSWYRVAMLHELAGQHQRASAAYERMNRAARSSGDDLLRYEALLGQGLAALRRSRTDEARAAYARAVTLAPGRVRALVGLAVASEEPARDNALQRAKRVNPAPTVDYHVGRLLLDIDQPKRALRPLGALIRTLPNYGRGHLLYAIALYRSGELQRAAEQAERAQQLAPRLYDSIYRSTPIFETATQEHPSVQSWARLAVFAEHYGELEHARVAWQQLKEAGVGRRDADIRLGWILLKENRPAEAIAFFRQAQRAGALGRHDQRGLGLAIRRTSGAASVRMPEPP
jgi:tetratricopeptide (TPR) repeat protein